MHNLAVSSSTSIFMRACRREPISITPVWLMRQAGRYLPEYRRVRERFSFLELCANSEAAAEITVGTVRRLGVDAAIVFADILLPLIPMRLGLRFEHGEGPVIERPLRDARDVEALVPVDASEALSFVGTTIELVRRDLRETPVIGFAGAPFTLAAYAIEGGSSRNFIPTKTMMYTQTRAWHQLMQYLTWLTADYLNMQIDAGADAVQLFDSWVGCLGPADYAQYVLPYLHQLIQSLKPGVPVIYFGTTTAGLLELLPRTGASVIGLDWRIDIADAWDRLGDGICVQGNLDPVRLFGDRDDVRRAVREVLSRVAGRPGHIFNLGHGVLPHTPVDNVLALVDAVHEYRSA